MASTRSRLTLCTLFLLATLTIGTISSAFAVEYSVWDWWTNKQGGGGMLDLNGKLVEPPWGNAFSGITTDNLWDLMTYNQGFTVPDNPLGDPSKAWLHVEFAGHREFNYFGWYEPTLSGAGPFTRHQIFDGNVDNNGDPNGVESADILLTPGQKIGFYLDYVPAGKSLEPGDAGYDPALSFFTEDGRNGDDATPSADDLNRSGGPVNAWGTTGFRHVRVFKDPTEPSGMGWIMAWEDQPMTLDGYDYAGAWDPTDTSSLDWAKGPEPDYNDMIIRFRFEGIPPPGTPELSTWLLLGLSLAAVPVLRRRRRS